jgi:putative NADH-flavin reductase
MNVLVIGGTRGVGKAVVLAAHAAGHTLTVMARHAAGFADPVSGVRTVIGDAADATDVERATAGQDAVVWTVGMAPTRRPVQLFSRGTQFLIAAMGKHNVHRLICVTGIGAGDSKGHGGFLYNRIVQPIFMKSIYEDKDRQEAQIRDSTLDWTIVRPAALTNGPATGLYQTLTSTPESHARRVSRADVADFVVANLSTPDFVRQTVLLTT